MSTTIHSASPETLTNATSETGKKSATDKISDAAETVRETAVKTAHDTMETATDTVRDVQDSLVKVGEKAREVTEKQPLVAVAGALAVGVLIGLAVNKNRY